jgi:hypothetical protein
VTNWKTLVKVYLARWTREERMPTPGVLVSAIWSQVTFISASSAKCAAHVRIGKARISGFDMAGVTLLEIRRALHANPQIMPTEALFKVQLQNGLSALVACRRKIHNAISMAVRGIADHDGKGLS